MAVYAMRAEYVHTCGGQALVNTHAVMITLSDSTELTPAIMGALANQLRLAWEENILANMAGDATLQVVRVRPIDGPALAPVEVLSGQTGGVSDGATFNQVAVVARLRTLFAGRSHRGRLYLGAVPQIGLGHTHSVLLPAEFAASWTAQLAAWLEAVNSIAIAGITQTELAVHSAKIEHTSNVTSITVNPVWGTQRRRLTGA